jgi:hypothetical protein
MMLSEFKCPSCKSGAVLGDSQLGQILFICQHCGTREYVKHKYNMSKPYYFISSENPFIADIMGKN